MLIKSALQTAEILTFWNIEDDWHASKMDPIKWYGGY